MLCKTMCTAYSSSPPSTVDEAGEIYIYDVNTNTNYNGDAEAAAIA